MDTYLVHLDENFDPMPNPKLSKLLVGLGWRKGTNLNSYMS